MAEPGAPPPPLGGAGDVPPPLGAPAPPAGAPLPPLGGAGAGFSGASSETAGAPAPGGTGTVMLPPPPPAGGAGAGFSGAPEGASSETAGARGLPPGTPAAGGQGAIQEDDVGDFKITDSEAAAAEAKAAAAAEEVSSEDKFNQRGENVALPEADKGPEKKPLWKRFINGKLEAAMVIVGGALLLMGFGFIGIGVILAFILVKGIKKASEVKKSRTLQLELARFAVGEKGLERAVKERLTSLKNEKEAILNNRSLEGLNGFEIDKISKIDNEINNEMAAYRGALESAPGMLQKAKEKGLDKFVRKSQEKNQRGLSSATDEIDNLFQAAMQVGKPGAAVAADRAAAGAPPGPQPQPQPGVRSIPQELALMGGPPQHSRIPAAAPRGGLSQAAQGRPKNSPRVQTRRP